MSLLGKYTDNIKSTKKAKPQISKDTYQLPAVVRPDDYGVMSMKKAIVISILAHLGAFGFVWLVLLICTIFGIDLDLLTKPKPKVNDIEFVLVDKQDTPRNKNTKYRADINSRSGGINNPKLPVSMPSASKPTAKPAGGGGSVKQPPKKQNIIEKVAKAVEKKPAQKPTQNTTTQKNVAPSPTVTQAIPKPQAAKPQPPTPRPSVKPPMTPKVVQAPTSSPFKVPVPSGGTKAGQYSTGPIGGTGTSAKGGSAGSGNYAPNPSLAPIGNGTGKRVAYGTGSGSGAGRGSGSGAGGYGTGGGNPGGGGGRPGIDAISEPDFGPYMRELQRRIKMNWDPPKGNESKRVVLLFKIAKDGRLLSCRVFKSSGLKNADDAAINAVHAAAPFRALPPNYKGDNIDIQFTFDYNVFGPTKY